MRLGGYEKDQYEQMEDEQREARQRELRSLGGDIDTPTKNPEKDSADTAPSKDSTPLPIDESSTKIKLSLQGAAGPLARKFPKTMTISTICRFYAKSIMHDDSAGGSIRLSVDGEVLDGALTLEETDLEDGDQVDVVSFRPQDKVEEEVYVPREIVVIDDDDD